MPALALRGAASLRRTVLLAALAHAAFAFAQTVDVNGVALLEPFQVTATRFGDPVQEVPASISVIRGEDLAARGAHDLRTALSLIGGVTVASGGDAGPAGAVPGLLGLREADDFLLLIDGIPAGGAFTPPFEIVSLQNVERIEVLRGGAPVYFGTTAFAGTINVIHYPAGKADAAATASYGSRGSVGVRAAAVLSEGPIAQSLSGEVSRDVFAGPRARADRAAVGYRTASVLAGGQAWLDLNLTLLRQKPASPTPLDDSGHLTQELPLDFNQNPSDARLDTDRVQLAAGFDETISLGRWGVTLALTRTRVENLRGFLIEGFDGATGDNATGEAQVRRLTDVFFDTHITDRPLPWLAITYGLNELYGRATQDSRTFSYSIPLDGSAVPDSLSGTPLDNASLGDRRSLFGIYAQSRINPTEQLILLAGLRWNSASERRVAADTDTSVDQSQTIRRWSGSLGAQIRLWQASPTSVDGLQLHASVSNTFQLPQLDFGPEAAGEPLLKPETQSGIEVGLKGEALSGRLDIDLAAFFVEFANQAVTAQIAGTPTLVNGGKNQFRGIELEAAYRLSPDAMLRAHLGKNDARYRDFTTLIDGTPTQLAGNRLPLTPVRQAGAGFIVSPSFGWGGSLVVNYIGQRFLDQLNTVAAGGYSLIDASVGYRFAGCTASLAGSNLSDRRDPVLASELGEGQIYRQPARRITLSVSVPLK
jgi:outer membrane receptor protein involved in Fe transport